MFASDSEPCSIQKELERIRSKTLHWKPSPRLGRRRCPAGEPPLPAGIRRHPPMQRPSARDLPDVSKGELPPHIQLQRTRVVCTDDAPLHVRPLWILRFFFPASIVILQVLEICCCLGVERLRAFNTLAHMRPRGWTTACAWTASLRISRLRWFGRRMRRWSLIWLGLMRLWPMRFGGFSLLRSIFVFFLFF